MKNKFQVIDLFCGIGGLSHGFLRNDFDVVAGVDIDLSCKFAFENNNKADFIHKDIIDLDPYEIKKLYDQDSIKILVGCAPCQPFSLMNTKKGQYTQEDIKNKSPIHVFADMIRIIDPDIISMENVPGIAKKGKYDSYQYFLDTLEDLGYIIGQIGVVNCVDYGIPQTRKRFVLIASKKEFGKIILDDALKVNTPVTLRETIGDLDAISHGGSSREDKYHVARSLSPVNLERVKLIKKNGGSIQDIPSKFRPECYKKKSGKSYMNNVYGRMVRDKPAPTMTTFCTGLGNGRFGHPEQDRAISLREAARIQTFPDYYKFTPDGDNVAVIKTSKQIGNAVPVMLGEVIAKSIKSFIS